jgi:hypothetical protein
VPAGVKWRQGSGRVTTVGGGQTRSGDGEGNWVSASLVETAAAQKLEPWSGAACRKATCVCWALGNGHGPVL